MTSQSNVSVIGQLIGSGMPVAVSYESKSFLRDECGCG